MRVTNYPNPPIAEAIINLQFRQDGEFDCTRIGGIAELLSDRFPTRSPIHLFELNVSSLPLEQAGPQHKSTEVGVRLATAMNDRILQIQQGNFSFSQLPPYSSWDPFSEEAARLWGIFSENYCSTTVTRCATRFINKIAIPSESIELHEYFHLYPKVPKGISQDVTGMLMQLQMPQPDLGECTAVINLALAQPEKPGHMTVILDIDLFTENADLPGSSPVLWQRFDKFRERKNSLFEAFITDKTRELFQ